MKPKTKRVRPIKAYAVLDKNEPLNHYCNFHRTKKQAQEDIHRTVWCEECGQKQMDDEDLVIIPVLITPLKIIKRK